MALTRATKERRVASLEADVTEARQAARRHRDRAKAAEEKAERLALELDWVKHAPVSDPLPEAEGGAE